MTWPTIFITSLLLLFSNISIAQDDLKILEARAAKRDTKTFIIRSLDGKKQKVQIVPDYVNRVLKISCSMDTIKIEDFWGVTPEINILDNKFVQIQYEVRGGTGLALGNVLILCVRKNKLYESMHALRYTQSEIGDDGYENYNIKMTLDKNDKEIYKLKVHVYNDYYSKSHPEKNYKYNDQTILNFDQTRNAFYSIKKDIYDNFITSYSKPNKTPKQVVKGNFPEIILGSETYYFIGNRWYTLEKSSDLLEFE